MLPNLTLVEGLNKCFSIDIKMAGEVSQSHAKSAGIISVIILICAVVNLITGFVFVSYGSKDATGIWIGLMVRLKIF